MRVRKLIIETLLKEAVEEDQIAAAALEDVFDQLEKDIRSNKDKLVPQQQNEAVAVALMGGALAAPVMIKLVGKAVKSLQNLLAKRKGEEPVDTNAIIGMGKKLHDLYIKGLEKSLFFIKDDKKRKRLAVIIFHAVIAGMLVASGKGFFKALAKHQSLTAFLEALLSAIKTGELGVFAAESFGSLATALGTATELSDAVELADMADVTEISTMAGGSVQGYSLPLGKKPEDYKMENKLRITKGRLRQILAEEVARHQKQKLNEMRDFKVGDQVRVVDGGLRGATGKIIEPITLITGEPGFVILLDSPADKRVFGQAGDEIPVGADKLAPPVSATLNEMTMAERGMVDAEDGNPPTKIGQGVEEYMKAYNAVMKKMGKDPLPMKQPDPAYLDALRRGQLEEMGVAEEEAEAASFAAQAKGAAATKAGAEGADAFYEGEELEEAAPSNEGMHTGEPKAPPMRPAVFIDLIASKLGMSREEVAKKMAMAMADIQAAEDSAERAGMSPSAGERERFSMATMEEEKTDKHDAEMKEKGFSDEQAENLPDELQKAMLKKEVRAMLDEMLKDD